MTQIIYEKKYPHIDSQEERDRIVEGLTVEPEEPRHTFDKIYTEIMEDTTYILIPKRMQSSKKFIRTAIEVAELYELDTKITRHVSHITVNYSFNCCGGMCDIKRVFGMADEFAFFKDIDGWDMTICMDYYTHAVVRRGRVVAPR